MSRRSWRTTVTSGLIAATVSAADSVLGRPTSATPWTTWRWRFDASTTSSSTTPIVPTPAAARYISAGDPRPPGADDEDPGVGQPSLALDADLGQQDVAGVPGLLLGGPAPGRARRAVGSPCDARYPCVRWPRHRSHGCTHWIACADDGRPPCPFEQIPCTDATARPAPAPVGTAGPAPRGRAGRLRRVRLPRRRDGRHRRPGRGVQAGALPALPGQARALPRAARQAQRGPRAAGPRRPRLDAGQQGARLRRDQPPTSTSSPATAPPSG